MNRPALQVVSPDTSPAARIARLQAEERGLAAEHLAEFTAALAEVARLAREVADGGELYPVGARELAKRIAADAAVQGFTLTAILERQPK